MATVAKEPASSEKKQRPSALRSVIAGSTAGAIEICKFAVLRRAIESHVLGSEVFRIVTDIVSIDSYYLPCRVYVCAAAIQQQSLDTFLHLPTAN